MTIRAIPLLLGVAGSAAPAQEPPARAVIAAPAAPAAAPGALVVPRDTLIRLMVMNEVTSSKVKAGDRFILRVDEPVAVNGVTIVPVGAKAWGEVLSAQKTGAVGKSGKLSARLVAVEVGGEEVPISGESKSEGEDASGDVVLGAVGLGPLALLMHGKNAKLKAGEIFNGYFEADMMFDPASSRLTAISGQAAAPKARDALPSRPAAGECRDVAGGGSGSGSIGSAGAGRQAARAEGRNGRAAGDARRRQFQDSRPGRSLRLGSR